MTKSIVHRDLKPGNVMLKPDGSVKVLDFGLAKVGPRTASGSEHDAEHSPTISMAATQAGVILGTAAYMSPEQARGKTVDKRADIWAFGVVLYEMVTGKRLFQGEDLTETLASVVKERPELSGAPPQMQRLLKRCLEKDPRKRLRGIGDVWELLDEEAPAAPAEPAAPRGWKSVLPWAAAAIFAIVAAVAFWAPWRASQPIDRPLVRLNLDLPGWVEGGFGAASVALSPDGTRIVYLQRGTKAEQPSVEPAASPCSPRGCWKSPSLTFCRERRTRRSRFSPPMASGSAFSRTGIFRRSPFAEVRPSFWRPLPEPTELPGEMMASSSRR